MTDDLHADRDADGHRDADADGDADQRPDRHRTTRSRSPVTQVDVHADHQHSLLGAPVSGTRQRHHLRQHHPHASTRPTARPTRLSARSLSAGIVSIVGSQTTLRVFIQGPPLNNSPIPDGLLYTCRFDVVPSAPPGIYTLISSNEIAQDPNALPVNPVAGTDGQITVLLVGPTSTPTLTPTVTDTPTRHADADRDADRHADGDRDADAVGDADAVRDADRSPRRRSASIIDLGDDRRLWRGQQVDVTGHHQQLDAGCDGRRHRQRHHLRQHRPRASIRRTASPTRPIGKLVSAGHRQRQSAPSSTLRVFIQGPPINNDADSRRPALHLPLRRRSAARCPASTRSRLQTTASPRTRTRCRSGRSPALDGA